MGLQGLMLLIIMLLFSFCIPSFSKNLIPEKTRENNGVNRINETNTTFGNDDAMANQSKYATAMGGGGGGGGGGGRSSGDGGESNTSPQGGGNGVIPVYVAGAAANHRNHKGGATAYTPCLKGWFAAIVATSAYLLLYTPL